ncbi:class I SAM-dependent methyltransferase [Pseudonocardia sp. MH-G8]|uniref:class I SAM-dependent methyltransferase n=1 Tax=Pseudonocardia sp. MH-G8 TaxID=1854588 RepID=UPI0018E95263|nr:class I SAM-dependent methyltransferase [Pseudonocardia sp. MH-G8]
MTELDTAIAANRANWDQRADVHARSQMYDVDGFLADRSAISQVVRNDVAVLAPHMKGETVSGRSLLHLQCHIGTDTISWVRLGAVDVHGLDLSPGSLAHARRIAGADGADVTWVEGDARAASSVIDRRFEVVVTSAGTIV